MPCNKSVPSILRVRWMKAGNSHHNEIYRVNDEEYENNKVPVWTDGQVVKARQLARTMLLVWKRYSLLIRRKIQRRCIYGTALKVAATELHEGESVQYVDTSCGMVRERFQSK